MTILIVNCALLVDFILGDPYTWPHPVKWMGHYIYFFQKKMLTEKTSPRQKYFLGGVLWLTTVGFTAAATWLILALAFKIHPLVGLGVSVYLSYTTLATKSLALEGRKVYQTLVSGTLDAARKQVSMIVGRETSQLTPEEIMKATVETVAENTCDGVIAPLFYLFLGGPVLAMSYKAVNTLDSMVGYQTPKYREIGYVSAKLDDLWNLLPARLSWLLLILASFCLGLDGKAALAIGWRDRYQHKSPNSGFCEAVAAGALGIQLGGSHIYHGVEVYKPTIGAALKPATPEVIPKMNRLLYTAVLLGAVIFSGIWLVVQLLL